VTAERREAIEISYSKLMLVHWFLFSGVSYCDSRESVFMFDYVTNEKEVQRTPKQLAI
jgi:hypothetical protein